MMIPKLYNRELALSLIEQDLKIHRLVAGLRGMDLTSMTQPDLSGIVLTVLGTNDDSETYRRYFGLLARHAGEPTVESATSILQALLEGQNGL